MSDDQKADFKAGENTSGRSTFSEVQNLAVLIAKRTGTVVLHDLIRVLRLAAFCQSALGSAQRFNVHGYLHFAKPSTFVRQLRNVKRVDNIYAARNSFEKSFQAQSVNCVQADSLAVIGAQKNDKDFVRAAANHPASSEHMPSP